MSANHPTLLRRTQVEAITGLARSTIYKLIKAGTFPKPIQLTDRAVAWPSNQIELWVSEKLAQCDVLTHANSSKCNQLETVEEGV